MFKIIYIKYSTFIKKSKISYSVLFLFFCAFVFAQTEFPNRLFSRTSKEYETIEILYAKSGIAPPTVTFPVTAREMVFLLSRIDLKNFDEKTKEIFWNLKQELEKTQQKQVTLSAGAHVSVEAYVQINPADFGGVEFYAKNAVNQKYLNTTITGEYGHRLTNDENLLYAYNERKPMLNVPLQFTFSPWVFAKITARLKNVRSFYAYEYPSINAMISTNVFTSMNYFDMTFPDEAYTAIDGTFFNVLAGRTQNAGFGNAKSGNLLLGEHLDYYDNLRIRFFSNYFAYTLQFTLFDTFFGYTSGSLSEADEKIEQIKPMDEAKVPNFLRYFISHRFESRIFDRINFAVSEGVMVHARTLQLQTFSPIAFLHNMYSYGTMNISLSLELDAYITNGFGIYAQWCSDQLVADPEIAAAPALFEPQAWAYLAGFNYSNFFNWGSYFAFLEFVLTEPYMYLELGQPDQYAYYRTFDNELYSQNASGGIRKIAKPIGYKYGADAIVITFGQQFVFGNTKIKPTVTYFIAGENNRALKYEKGKIGNGKRTPTGTPEHTIIVQNKAEYAVTDFLKVYGHTGIIYAINYINELGRKAFDFQLTLGASIAWNGTLKGASKNLSF